MFILKATCSRGGFHFIKRYFETIVSISHQCYTCNNSAVGKQRLKLKGIYKMTFLSAHKSDTGRKLDHNQDYLWLDDAAGIYIVADGMGGQDAGELASELAATNTGEFIRNHLRTVPGPLSTTAAKQLIITALETANDAVLTAAQEARQDRPMGAAIVLALVSPPTVYICHAGDARAYLKHNSTLTRLTVDDSWVARLVAAGVITEEQARYHPLGNILTKAVGHESPLEPAFRDVTVAPGDWLLLCSDGLWKMIGDELMATELQRVDSAPADVVEALVEAANAAGGHDNISLILVRITP
jgi:protein phosphatase